ncbi:hypothetical protein GN330_22875 [Nitratireductor sp. CAU 1489]|uniref:Uncharacterized protein n=1 Tax=Nitratireductor arenosus TaxID=2682096 RepID=A0A844QQ69_9HYPH|nr:hypothetical protein [Nitratireductor arenosus]MVB00094.1 hypothetical protein [Nitratireductor arenosus]
MDKQAHTHTHAPGPWEYNDPKKYTQGHGKFSETAVYAPGALFYWRMAEVQGPDEATEIATARLIAAAPDLLEALDWAIAEIEGRTRYDRERQFPDALSSARAALSKATGGE